MNKLSRIAKHILSMSIEEIERHKIYINPSSTQILNLTKNSRNEEMRWIIIDNDIYLWDAYHLEHHTVAKHYTGSERYDNCGYAIFDNNIFVIFSFYTNRPIIGALKRLIDRAKKERANEVADKIIRWQDTFYDASSNYYVWIIEKEI